MNRKSISKHPIEKTPIVLYKVQNPTIITKGIVETTSMLLIRLKYNLVSFSIRLISFP